MREDQIPKPQVRADHAGSLLRPADLSQLATCAQCGLASAAEGNDDVDEATQRRKLEEMARARAGGARMIRTESCDLTRQSDA